MRLFRPKEAELDGACGAEDGSGAHGREGENEERGFRVSG